MSTAVPSDGKVNTLFLAMIVRGFVEYSLQEVEEVLTEDKLKQCKYETLIAIQNSLASAFKKKSWPVHAQIIIKAEQSSNWRNWREKHLGGSCAATAIGVDKGVDPLKELKNDL